MDILGYSFLHFLEKSRPTTFLEEFGGYNDSGPVYTHLAKWKNISPT